MGGKKSSVYRIVLVLIIVVALVMLFFSNVNAITGHATESTTTSNVTIQKYLSLALCSNLSAGISFGDVSALPATDLNGTHNYDGVNSGTSYCVNVSNDGNTPIDVCLKADGDLSTLASDVIGLANETYANASLTNSTIPALGSDLPLTTSYVKAGENIPVGNLSYYRFWLDIPAAQPSGDYNNTVYFKGVTTTLSCGV